MKLTLELLEERLQKQGYGHRMAADAIYVNFATPIHMICGNCGNGDWWPTPNNLLCGRTHPDGKRGSRYCDRCRPTAKKAASWIEQKIAKSRESNGLPQIVVLEKANGVDSPLRVRCSVCGYEFAASPTNLYVKKCCPNCNDLKTSHFERFLASCLVEYLGPNAVLRRDRSRIGMELDIYLPDYDLAIEPGSWFYHKNTNVVRTDELKEKRCKEEGIKLLRIYYHCTGGDSPRGQGVVCVPRGNLMSDSQVSSIFSFGAICFDESRESISFLQAKQIVNGVIAWICGKEVTDQILNRLWHDTFSASSSDGSLEALRRLRQEIDGRLEIDITSSFLEKGIRRYGVRCLKHDYECSASGEAILKAADRNSGCPNCPGCSNRMYDVYRGLCGRIDNPYLEPLKPIRTEKGTRYQYRCLIHQDVIELSAKKTFLKRGHEKDNTSWCKKCQAESMLEIGKREILNTDIELLDLYWDSSARVPRWKCLYHCKTHESGVMECELTTLRKWGTKLHGCPKCPRC